MSEARPLTENQKRVLQMLLNAAESGNKWLSRERIDTSTQSLNALERSDWIAARHFHDGTVDYKITVRGQRKLESSKPQNRLDGICPICGERPRHRTPSGNLRGYCRECGNARNVEYNQRRQSEPRFCRRCHTNTARPYSPYCADCVRQSRIQNRRRAHQSRIQRYQKGEIFTCAIDGCNEPCVVHPKSVSNYCVRHEREKLREGHKARFAKRFAQKVRYDK